MLNTRVRLAVRGREFAPGRWDRWAYRRAVTVDNSAGASDLVHYAVRIALTGSNWNFAHAEGDGSDVRVTGSDGKLIPYFIEDYDDAGQVATIWARVPYVAAGGTATLYLYSGNTTPAAFQVPPTGKWTRPASGVMAGLAENMVYDTVTAQYYVVFSNTDAGPISIASAGTPGGTWTDEGVILNPGASGQWDDQYVFAPHLIEQDGDWYLFYTGAADTSENSHQSGVAVSTTGILGTYVRSVSNPIIAPSGIANWKRYRAMEAHVYWSDILSKWVMLYMGDSGSGATQIEQVGYATADAIDGPYTDYANNPVIAFGATGSIDDGTIADPFALEIDGVAWIGYTSGGGSAQPWDISFVTTTDYVTFRKVGPVFSTAVETRFDDFSAFRGAVSRFGDTYYLPYAGYDGSDYTWAVATLSAVSGGAGCDPLAVLDFYDHFDGAVLDSDLWQVPSTAARSAGSESLSASVLTLNVTSGTNVGRLVLSLRRFGVGFMAEFRVKHTTADGGGTNAGEVGFFNDALTRFLRLYDYNTGFWKKSVGGGSETVSNMAQAISTSFVTQRVFWESSASARFQNDSSGVEQITTNIPTDTILPVGLFAFRGSQNTQLDVDYVLVRKYVGADPTMTVGSEESL